MQSGLAQSRCSVNAPAGAGLDGAPSTPTSTQSLRMHLFFRYQVFADINSQGVR